MQDFRHLEILNLDFRVAKKLSPSQIIISQLLCKVNGSTFLLLV